MRLVPRTLRWRLALASAALIAVSFCITFVVVYGGTGSAMRGQIDRELQGDAQELSRTLGRAHARSPRALALAATGYVENQPFRTSSTLLYVTVPGQRVVTNQPELMGLVGRPDSGETASEQAREDRGAARLLRGGDGYTTVGLPDVGALRVVHRTLLLHVGAAGASPGRPLAVGIGVGEPLAAVSSAQAGVARAFIFAGIIVLAAALLGAYALGTRFSAPLRRMASVAARVDAGDLYPRIHDPETGAVEVMVLAEAFNHMLDRLSEAFGAQREFVADASHELRTPLTVLRGQIELLLAQERPDPEELRRVGALVQAEIARMSRLVEELLELARAERSEELRLQEVDLLEWIPQLWEGMRVLAERRFELSEIPDGTLRADPDRLAQALRNVVANAIDHTSAPDGLVRLAIHMAATRRPEERRIVFAVEDDGPGIPGPARERIFERFHRTDRGRDRRSGGAGLGLAIVRAIAHAHGGAVRAGAAGAGGARIELELPGFTPAPSSATDAEGEGSARSRPGGGDTGGAAPHGAAPHRATDRPRVRAGAGGPGRPEPDALASRPRR